MRKAGLLLFCLGLLVACLITPTPVSADVDKAFDAIGASCSDPAARVRFLPENMEAWYARWYVLDNAKKSIDITYFIVEQDVFGMSMLGLLMKKARAGLDIRVMVDARGTKGLTRTFFGQDILQEMAKFPNVKIRVFNPVHRRLFDVVTDLRRIIGSNHDKIVLVDNEYLVTGGRNISRNYFVDPADLPQAYRDTDVVIHSPIVARQAKLAFDEEFASLGNFKVTGDLLGNLNEMQRHLDLAYHAMRRYMLGMGLFKIEPGKFSKKTQTLLEKYVKELKEYSKLTMYSGFRLFQGERQHPTRVLDKHSIRGPRNDITNNLISLMDAATSEIIIQNPYVVLTPVCEAALKRANDRGVKIVIHTNSPMSTDSLLTQAMFVGDWRNILKTMPNVRIFGYALQSKLHSKVFVFDRKVAVIGTYNMDYMSEQINSEIVTAVKSPSFARQVALRIEEDLKHSKEYKIKVNTDGSVTTVFGPESHSDAGVMRRLNILLKLHFLRPII